MVTSDHFDPARLEIVLRLLLAMLAGALLGYDRERAAKPAGLRTHMLVALGSAAFMVGGLELGADLLRRGGAARFDPTHLMQGLVGGMGFLCAGAVIHERGRVEGLTTAASVWMTGAIGAAAGMGEFFLATVCAVFAAGVLWLASVLEARIRPRPRGPTDDRAERRNGGPLDESLRPAE